MRTHPRAWWQTAWRWDEEEESTGNKERQRRVVWAKVSRWPALRGGSTEVKSGYKKYSSGRARKGW